MNKAAEAWADQARRERVGKPVSALVRPGMAEAEAEAALAACNGERRA